MELDLIERIAATCAVRPGVLVGIGDDAAVLRGDPPMATTHDMLVEDVHFRLDATSLADLGHKAIAVNLSDLAAMGARPVACLVGLGIPADGRIGPTDVEELYGGMDACAAEHGATIAGGDVVTAPTLVIAVTAIGMLDAAGAPVLRSGARPGDVLCVTGSLGAAAAGLALIADPSAVVSAAARERVLSAHRRPTPRVAAGIELARRGATAMLDCSDGLGLDALRLARASGVAVRIDLERLPIDPGTREAARALGIEADILAATGGDDYELIAALPADRVSDSAAGIPLTPIGEIHAGDGIRLQRDGVEVHPPRLGWEHGVASRLAPRET